MANDVLTYVPEVELKGGKIVLTVQTPYFEPGEPIEISGQATQGNGAFAPFYDIQNAPADGNSLEVTANPVIDKNDPKEFQPGDVVTVAVRVAKVWVTMLAPAKSAETGVTVWTESEVATLEAYH